MSEDNSVDRKHKENITSILKLSRNSNCDIRVTGSRMEKGSLKFKRSKVASYWGETHDPGITERGQSEYLTRLMSLRDSLVDQGQNHLAKAVERLRQHSLTNKSNSDRLRMNGCDVKHPACPIQRTNMLTTVEKFRQMRPQQPQPVILPLEGRQIFAGLSQKRPSSDITSLEGSANISGPDGEACETVTEAHITPSEIEDTIQNNLLRLTQPTSKIPNVGRKARKSNGSLDIKMKSLLTSRTRVCKQTGKHLASPFLPFDNARSLSSLSLFCTTSEPTQRNTVSQPRIGESAPIRLSANALSANDKSDKEIVQYSRQEDFIHCNTPESHENKGRSLDSGSCGSGGDRGYTSSQQPSSKMRVHNKQQAVHSPATLKRFKKSETKANSESIHDTVRNGFMVNQSQNEAHKLDYNSADYSIGIIQLLPEQQPRAPLKNRIIYSLGDRDESDTELLDDKETRFPDIYQTSIQPSYRPSQRSRKTPRTINGSGIDLNIRNIQAVILQHGQGSETEVSKPDNLSYSSHFRETPENNTKRKLILVDMPNIIFNAPSPVPGCSFLDDNGDESSNKTQFQSSISPSSLKMTVQQQEIRRRELTNLLEDVKELNNKTEALKLQSTTEAG